MKSAEIRQAFLNFFKSKGHQIESSSSLVPADDPTLLFTNAGMNQFKDCFLGLEKRPYTRATTSQKCVRAGGKHNDLENVGYTARHHTFFEMLGNFSFGDYFKQDAINYAWEFLTSGQYMGIPKEKLYVTVYESDDEAYDIWTKEVGVPEAHMIRIGDNKGAPYASDNFWAMGDTGPCGPCTEIFYDHGEDVEGGLPGTPEEDGDRFIEIWNVVFMQFNRTADGEMHPLPAPSVDTGMGLERISAVMQHVHANYEIDLFQSLLKAVADAVGCANDDNPSLKVIADHIRSCSFLIADGVIPSNEGRGYVLRRIIRRACRHGNKLGAKGLFFHKVVDALVAEMGEAFPELKTQRDTIVRLLKSEEEQFAKTLEQGLRILEQDLAELKGKVIPGEVVFKLYDTYGFPMDLTADIARERDLEVDEDGFEAAMEAQRERARAGSSFGLDYNSLIKVDQDTVFTGYDATQGEGKIIALFRDGQEVERLNAGEEGVIVLDQTPFYAESGGQVGDCGTLISGAKTAGASRFDVRDTQKASNAHVHHGVLVEGSLAKGDTVNAQVEADLRDRTARNHSATHLLHAALRQVLGEHVQQKGSLVDSQRFRFDFSHFEAMTDAQIAQAEAIVNAQIRANTPVQTELMELEAAKEKGAMALFGEKYAGEVRVLTMGSGSDENESFSIELCGGIHAKRTGDIGFIRITSEAGIASGVRRVEAVAGAEALTYTQAREAQLSQASAQLKTKPEQLVERLTASMDRSKQLEKELEQLKAKLASAAGSDLAGQAIEIGDVKLLAMHVEGADGKSLRDLMDQLKNKLGRCALVLAAVKGDKVSLIAGVSKDLTGQIKAGELVNHVATQVGGKGGGRPDMAQAGGSDPAALPAALQSVQAWVESKLA
ncbi:alanine--tRNA ligase [Oceanospirillum linum]|uniref:Alanine--tRNA ligase n=1 Tax=Oceanospirillum linum TaxID=966 RepID=A0A1T1HAZ4_OCELI|nr:alanine--tRNA ligase [Oceanospirillum linum]OOV86995.1 alanine--tRNA ligase [Oceanospirillum linum]SEF70987.1 alanyl-tRNA synthetase [Oleiphilus messinensis]SMP15458.1 alanyl-tRNA synthetase [Oceanospirillum linum]